MSENRARVILNLPEKGKINGTIDGLFNAKDLRSCRHAVTLAYRDYVRARRKSAKEMRLAEKVLIETKPTPVLPKVEPVKVVPVPTKTKTDGKTNGRTDT